MLRKCTYKDVFNIIYKKFLQNKNFSNSKIVEYDIKYNRIFKELINLPSNPKDNLKIYLANVGPEKKDIDVCLLDELEDELFSLDFVDWSDLIDLNLFNSAKITRSECLAHILWEITFWGSSQEAINEQKKKTFNKNNEK